MKKFISICLAVAMIFAVCAISVFADPISTNDRCTNDNVNYLYYVDPQYDINAEGTLEYFPATNSVKLYVYCTNIGYDAISEYNLFAQCAVNYTDGSQDFFTLSRREFIDHETKFTSESFSLATGKTVASFDAEFFILYENDTLWEGQIYEPLA